jgi:hypothetical protein
MPDILSELVHSMPSSSSLRLRAGPLRSFGSQTDGNPVPVGLKINRRSPGYAGEAPEV